MKLGMVFSVRMNCRTLILGQRRLLACSVRAGGVNVLSPPMMEILERGFLSVCDAEVV